ANPSAFAAGFARVRLYGRMVDRLRNCAGFGKGMNMKNREPAPAVYLAAVLATEKADGGGSPTGFPTYRAARDAESLVRLGKRALRIAEQRCNGIERYDAAARRVLAS